MPIPNRKQHKYNKSNKKTSLFVILSSSYYFFFCCCISPFSSIDRSIDPWLLLYGARSQSPQLPWVSMPAPSHRKSTVNSVSLASLADALILSPSALQNQVGQSAYKKYLFFERFSENFTSTCLCSIQ